MHCRMHTGTGRRSPARARSPALWCAVPVLRLALPAYRQDVPARRRGAPDGMTGVSTKRVPGAHRLTDRGRRYIPMPVRQADARSEDST